MNDFPSMRRVNLLRAHGSPTGYMHLADGCRCAACMAQQSERRRRRYAANPEAGREASRRYRAKWTPEQRREKSEYGKRYKRAHPEDVAAYRSGYAAANRDKVLRAKYGVTSEEWDELMAAQGGACAICGSADHRGNGWHTDHNHDTGKVRGILCHHCNVGIGLFQDDPAGLIAAAEYLRAAL